MEQYYNNEKVNQRGLKKKYSHFVMMKDMMLMMDDASMHKIDIVKDKIKKCKSKISMIHGELQDIFNLKCIK